MIGRKGITGGELIELTVKDGDEDEFKITKEHKMMLNAVRDMNTTSQVQEQLWNLFHRRQSLMKLQD